MPTSSDRGVAVIIPARNAALTLAETLDSLARQTSPDWVAYVIDDASTDDTVGVLNEYARREPRIRAISGLGSGAAGARNLGLAAATETYVLFLDSDDWVAPNFIECMRAALEASPEAAAAYCDFVRILPDGSQDTIAPNPVIAQTPFEIFARRCGAPIHAIFFKLELLDEVGHFDEGLTTCEDWDLWQRIARTGRPWIYIEKALSFYRMSAGSLTRDGQQLISDAQIVIERGFGPDPRVRCPNAAHREGADKRLGSAQVALAFVTLWCGAIAAGGGQPSLNFVDELAGLPRMLDRIDAVAWVIFDGLVVGARAPKRALAARWNIYARPLDELIAAILRVWREESHVRLLRYRIERLILDHDDLAKRRPLGLTLGLRVDVEQLAAVTPPPGVDRLYVYFCVEGRVQALLDLGTLGTMTVRDWTQLASTELSWDLFQRTFADEKRPRVLLHAVLHAARLGLRRRSGYRAIWQNAVNRARFSVRGPANPPGSHGQRIRDLRLAAASAAKQTMTMSAIAPAQRWTEIVDWGDRKAFWETMFKVKDPWNYGSAYEQEKFERQLELLPDGTIGQALELASAEGHFTEKLAERVESLIASDISTTALERARTRLGSSGKILFRLLDLTKDALPTDLDLIVCSEVLYYLSDEEELGRVARRLVGALRPGGAILTAHAYVLTDDMSRTGFDWNSPFGAEAFARAFIAVPGLALERSIQTELYRVDRFVRIADGAAVPKPVISTAPINATLEPNVARLLIRGGVVMTRARAAKTEQSKCIPILMYHSVSEGGPEALRRFRVSSAAFRDQLGWLRRNGYHAIGTSELAWYMANKYPIAGRPILISFDDGYQDFADNAWPILYENDFIAEMFVVTDLVGTVSSWDRDYGEPIPLMDAPTIGRLAREGVRFGSHLATHRPATGLSTVELAEELTRSSQALGSWIGGTVQSFAAPYGLLDQRVRRLAAACGYSVGLATTSGIATIESNPLDLPRIEVRGDASLDDFIASITVRP